MMNSSKKGAVEVAALREQANNTLRAFLETEVDLAVTFWELAQYERSVGHAEHYERLMSSVRVALETIHRFKGRLPADAKRHIKTRAEKLNRFVPGKQFRQDAPL